MPDLLDRTFSGSSRITRSKRQRVGDIESVAEPRLDEPKHLFITIRSMAAAANVVSRGFRRIVREYGAVTAGSELDAFDEVIVRWGIERFRGRVATQFGGPEQTPRSSFLDNAKRLDRRGQTDAALDLIFDQIDEMLLAGEFEQVDQLLTETTLAGFSVELLLGILTATLPAKNHLPNRGQFFRQVSESLQDRGELKEGLLVGLD